MHKSLLSRYIWLVDTLRREGRLTREQLNEHWRQAPFSEGTDMPRRTLYGYRAAIEELFGIVIDCDSSTYEYFISPRIGNQHSMAEWLYNSVTTNNVMSDARDLAGRIFIDDVPSARAHLQHVVDAMRQMRCLRFVYSPYSRSLPSKATLEPYFLKIFRNRWYVTGRQCESGAIRTYSLDRMNDVKVTEANYEMPEGFDAAQYARDSFGIVFDDSEVQTIVLRADVRQAKYFRALPLHHSQREEIHDRYSVFTYRMRITPDLVEEILSFGPRVTALEPLKLQNMVVDALRSTLSHYEKTSTRSKIKQRYGKENNMGFESSEC